LSEKKYEEIGRIWKKSKEFIRNLKRLEEIRI